MEKVVTCPNPEFSHNSEMGLSLAVLSTTAEQSFFFFEHSGRRRITPNGDVK